MSATTCEQQRIEALESTLEVLVAWLVNARTMSEDDYRGIQKLLTAARADHPWANEARDGAAT